MLACLGCILILQMMKFSVGKENFNKGTFIEAYNALGHITSSSSAPTHLIQKKEKYFKGPYYKTRVESTQPFLFSHVLGKKENTCRYLLSVYSPSEKLNVDFSTYQAKCHYSSHLWIFKKVTSLPRKKLHSHFRARLSLLKMEALNLGD